VARRHVIVALSVGGVLIAALWVLLVLPLLGITGPAPGREGAAFVLALAPPVVASGLLLGAALLGFRKPELGRRAWVTTAIAVGLSVVGCAGLVYSALLGKGLIRAW
jgi:hypothetical protein